MTLLKHVAMAGLCGTLLATGLLKPSNSSGADVLPETLSAKGLRVFRLEGVITEVRPDQQTLVIRHEAIPDYMQAMTMPFHVKDPKAAIGFAKGDRISCRLQMSENESWIDQITKTGSTLDAPKPAGAAVPSANVRPHHPLLDYHFTNELGRAVALADFRGEALAITFFFTRCPIPDFCPRLSKNFEEAGRKIAAMSNAPTNWHMLSVTFDPAFDTPPVLKAYGERHHYDPNHWSFLTGPEDKIRELAGQSDVTFERDGASYNHNFRTLIIDAAGHVQMIFPTSGDLSDAIAAELLKGAAVTNRPS
jgi:protein SCO1/2